MIELQWLIQRFRPQLFQIALGCGLASISALLATCDPILMKILLDSALPQRNRQMALLLAGLVGCILVGRGLFGVAGTYLNFRASQDFAKTLRIDVLKKMSTLSADFHEQTPTGDKLSQLENDIDLIAELCSDCTGTGLRVLISLILNCAAICLLSPAIGIPLVLLVPLFAVVRRVFRNSMQERADVVQAEKGRVASVLCEVIAGLPQLQLLCAEHLGIKRAVTAWDSMFRAQQKQREAELLSSTAISNMINIGIIGTLIYGSLAVVHGRITIGALVAIYAYVARMFDPVIVGMDLYARFQRGGASIRRSKALLDRVPSVSDRGTCILVPSTIAVNLEVRDLRYEYVPSREILKELSFNVGGGERIAIAGKSGSGKSTLARLLVRFADPQHGTVLLAGRRSQDYSLAELRTAVCYVPQTPVLFSGTIRENLLYGNAVPSKKALQRVLDAVQLSPLLSRLPQGVDTFIGFGANRLSGGELQRLTLARALLRKSPVLVLDESTSALDIPTEREVLQGIAQYRSGAMTLIIISHRLASLTWVDRIVIIANGRVAAEGTHRYLCSHVQLYGELYAAEAANVQID